MCHLRVLPGRRCWTVPSPSGSRGEGKALPGSLLCYLWLQRTLRSRLVFCVRSLTAQGAHRGRPVAAAPCTPGLRPATSPLRGAFDLSLQASGRAEAASVQNTALSPHPCGLPRPSGNVSAMLRPQHRQFQQDWWVTSRQVARTVGRARR